MKFQCPLCKGINTTTLKDLKSKVACGHCNEIIATPAHRFDKNITIDEYVILSHLIDSPMSNMYKAHQESLDRDIALKVLSDKYSSNSDLISDFFQEARAAAQLTHPNVVQIYAVNAEDEVYYIAMEFVEGHSLDGYLKTNPSLPKQFTLDVFHQIAEALNFAWMEHKLTHQNIKLENILISETKVAKLSGLGSSHRSKHNLEEDELASAYYNCPEKLLQATIDFRSDIYMLGVAFFKSLTGKFPYEGNSASAINNLHLKGTIPRASSYDKKIYPAIDRTIDKMLAKHPDDRYSSYQELINDIKLLKELNVNKRTYSAPQITLENHKRFNPLLIIIFALLITLVAASIYISSKNSSYLIELDKFQRNQNYFEKINNDYNQLTVNKDFNQNIDILIKQINYFKTTYPKDSKIKSLNKIKGNCQELKIIYQRKKFHLANNSLLKKSIISDAQKQLLKQWFIRYSKKNDFTKMRQEISNNEDNYKSNNKYYIWTEQADLFIKKNQDIAQALNSISDSDIYNLRTSFIDGNHQIIKINSKSIAVKKDNKNRVIPLSDVSIETLKNIMINKVNAPREEAYLYVACYLTWLKCFDKVKQALIQYGNFKNQLALFIDHTLYHFENQRYVFKFLKDEINNKIRAKNYSRALELLNYLYTFSKYQFFIEEQDAILEIRSKIKNKL